MVSSADGLLVSVMDNLDCSLEGVSSHYLKNPLEYTEKRITLMSLLEKIKQTLRVAGTSP